MSPRPSRETREQVVQNLRDRLDGGEQLNAEIIGRACELLDTKPSTLRRWINHGVPRAHGRPRTLTLTSQMEELAFATNGNCSRIAEELRAAGIEVSRQTVKRLFERDRATVLLDSAKGGERAMRKHLPRIELDADHRNQVWQADCSHLPIELDLPAVVADAKRKVWVTAFMDCATRAIMGYAISVGSTTSDSVLVALADSIRRTPERGPFAGAPDQIIYDNGKQYLAEAVLQAELLLGIAAAPCKPYTPEHKGKIERFFRTLKEELVLDLPFAMDGPKRINGELYETKGSQKLTLIELRARLDEWIVTYNLKRPHQSLDGRTPLEAWNDDSTELRLIDDAQLTYACMQSATRKVQARGVWHSGRWYQAAELSGLVGQQVEVRFMRYDHRHIEVFWEKEWLCTALPKGLETAEDHEALQVEKKKIAKRVSNSRKRTKRMLRARLTPAAPGQDSEVGTVVTREEARDVIGEVRRKQAKARAERTLSVVPDPDESDVWEPEDET